VELALKRLAANATATELLCSPVRAGCSTASEDLGSLSNCRVVSHFRNRLGVYQNLSGKAIILKNPCDFSIRPQPAAFS